MVKRTAQGNLLEITLEIVIGAHPEFFLGWGRGLTLRLYIIYVSF
jgi:hypothetical protein